MPADGTLPQVVESFPVGKTGDRFLDAEIAKERVRISLAKADQPSGVRWSGMDAEPFRARTIGQMIDAADKARRSADSPRGRFLKALAGAEQLPTYEAQIARVRSLYDRDLADDRQPLNVAAVGAALVMLNDVPGKDARTAIDCLAELLMNERRAA